jgi:hypothetical protein
MSYTCWKYTKVVDDKLEIGERRDPGWHGVPSIAAELHAFCDLHFALSFAAALPAALFSFAAFMSFGAVVRTCLMCVGVKLLHCVSSDGVNHCALSVGTESNRGPKEANSGVSLWISC